MPGDDGSWPDGAAGPSPAGIRPLQTLGLQEFSTEKGPHSQGFLKNENSWVLPSLLCPGQAGEGPQQQELGAVGSITSGLCPAAITSCLCFIDPTCLFSIQFVLKCGSLGF